ncbi:MAG: hypothetical protein CNF01_07575 [Halieaceae bacterium MED-G27]|jgi:hypothetical protein|nr:MAG: hypothetical protein CNF01_07575 [Halieaceae bacterium MED-G27]|tara:strand:- start:13836 stop:14609 length:774 start_codon:yes stop_codon:yes gene_type:complete
MDKTTPSDETVVTSSATESNTVISEDSTASENTVASFELLEAQLIARQVAAMEGQVEKFVFRTSLAAVVAILFGGILLFAASGRLAGEIDNMQAASLSITKRIVNLNASLDKLTLLEQKIDLLEQSSALFEKRFIELVQAQKNTSAVIESAVANLQQPPSAELTPAPIDFSDVERQLSLLTAANLQLQQVIDANNNDINRNMGKLLDLRDDVSQLIDIEKRGLVELLEAQVRIQTDGSSRSNPATGETDVVFPVLEP